MKLITFLGITILIGLAVAGPTPKDIEENTKVTVDSEIIDDVFKVYTSKHEILKLTVPLNAINTGDVDDNNSTILFFVEGDVDDKGNIKYKGLYSLIDGKATKLLETGTDAAAADDDTTKAYFSAKDGIYIYDGKTKKLKKYGNITDSLIGIAKPKAAGVVYVLTSDHEVYKVTDNGNKKEKLDLKDVQEIVLDFSDNLYFYGKDKVPCVVTADGVKKINGLPENPTYVQLIKPPFIIEDAVLYASDNELYAIYVNGTVELSDFILELKPTSYAPEAAIIQYYGYNKCIYEYNIILLVGSELSDEIKKILDKKEEEIQSIASRSKLHLYSPTKV